MAHSTPEIKSYVVSFDYEGRVRIEPSHWAPGYTSGHKATELEALQAALRATNDMRNIYKDRAHALRMAMSERCELCNYDRHQCGGCGEPLEHGQYACGPCSREHLDYDHG